MSADRKLAALSPDARKAALAALDEISRPLTKNEVEDLMTRTLSRSLRRQVARALTDQFDIIVLERRPDNAA